MEAKIMKMAKKFLAVALAGVLALSVLTGCGASVKSKDIVDALNKMNVKVEQDKDMDKTAENTLKAIEAIVNAPDNAAKPDTDTSKITLDNAVELRNGKIIKINQIVIDNHYAVSGALGMCDKGNNDVTPAQKANRDKNVKVSLVKTENATKDASLQAALVKDGLVAVNNIIPSGNRVYAESGKLGFAKTKDGKYILVVIVTDMVEKH
jgi:sensor c-di-GMP phosphodiesterase-like protein